MCVSTSLPVLLVLSNHQNIRIILKNCMASQCTTKTLLEMIQYLRE